MKPTEPSATPNSDFHAELMERIERNLDKYHDSLMGFEKRELIEMAGRIHAMSDAYSYLCDCDIEDGELEFLLKFQNPLEVVAEGWLDHNIDNDDVMGFAFADVMRRKEDWLASYPLVSMVEEPVNSIPRRFMDAVLTHFIDKVAPNASDENGRHWSNVGRDLYDAAASDDTYDKRMILLVGSSGGTLLHERDVLIRHSEPFNAVVKSAAEQGAKGYFVEAISVDGSDARINVFDCGSLADYAEHLRNVALRCNSVVLAYASGEPLVVSADEYRQAPEKYETHHGHPLKYSYYVPDNMRDMDRLMDAEMSIRMEYACGEPLFTEMDKLKALKEQLRKNFADCTDNFNELEASKQALQASDLTAMKNVYEHMMFWQEYSESELDCLLLFQNPLRVVTDDWVIMGRGDISQSVRHIMEAQTASHAYYALEKSGCDAPGVEPKELDAAQQELPAKGKPSIAGKLHAGKAKAEANRAKSPATKTKNVKKENDLA